jgi:prepilin-type N-terminal cleavage/methylation domain-containing protein
MSHTERQSLSGAARGGFTMVEMIIALVILSIGILAVSALSATSIWQTKRGDDLTNAAIAAQRVLDELSTLPFDSLIVGTYADTISFGPADYVVQWTIADAPDSLEAGAGDLKQIVALSGGGVTQTNPETFELYIFEDGNQ